MSRGPSDTILVAIRITLRIRESKVRNPDPPDRRSFVLSFPKLRILHVCQLSRVTLPSSHLYRLLIVFYSRARVRVHGSTIHVYSIVYCTIYGVVVDVDRAGMARSQKSEETLVWQRVDDRWKLIHLHRSVSSAHLP